jgi:hypothetical protein
VLGTSGAPPSGKGQVEQVFRLGLGSWAGRLRRVDLWLEPNEDAGGGLGTICRIHASLLNGTEVSVQGLGADCGEAVQSATRHLVRHIRRHVVADRPFVERG